MDFRIEQKRPRFIWHTHKGNKYKTLIRKLYNQLCYATKLVATQFFFCSMMYLATTLVFCRNHDQKNVTVSIVLLARKQIVSILWIVCYSRTAIPSVLHSFIINVPSYRKYRQGNRQFCYLSPIDKPLIFYYQWATLFGGVRDFLVQLQFSMTLKVCLWLY